MGGELVLAKRLLLSTVLFCCALTVVGCMTHFSDHLRCGVDQFGMLDRGGAHHHAGYTGVGQKTIIFKEALAKADVRLVGGQNIALDDLEHGTLRPLIG